VISTHRNLPPIVNGYPLESGKSWFSIIVPVARTNEVTNPSLETNSTGYTAGAGSLARSTAQQYHGAYSAAYTPSAAVNDGFYYTLTSTVAIRAVSCKFKGAPGIPYALTYSTSGGVDLVTKTFTATGRWQWIWLYYNDASATTRRIYFRKNGSASVAIYYVDGVQSEIITAGETVSTYIDGDQLGLAANQSPVAYYWTGTPHASTSVRSSQTRAGGMVIPMHKYGFLLTAMIGLGLAGVQNIATDYARIDGSYPDYTRKPSRQFTLSGRFQATTPAQLDRYRGALSALLDRDLTGQDQELLLRYERLATDGRPASEAALLRAKYVSGLGGNADNLYAENVPLTFIQYLPTIAADGEDGESLAVQLSVSNANAILQRSPAGVWSAMGTGVAFSAAPIVRALARGTDGRIWAGGDFVDMGGVAAGDDIAIWTPSTAAWSAVGASGANNTVFAIAVGADGKVYAGGNFSSIAGTAANGIAYYDGSWHAMGTGVASGAVEALAVDNLGRVWAGGSFTNMGGVGAADGIAYWDGAAWNASGASGTAGGDVLALATIGTRVYAGGTFTSINGVTMTRIGYYDGTWHAMGSGLNNQVTALTISPNQQVVAGGLFTASGSVTINKVGAWNGVTWQPLTSTMDGAVVALGYDSAGRLWAGGNFATINGVTIPDGLAILTGQTWTYGDVDFPGVATVYSLLPASDGTLYVGFDTRGSAAAAATTTITNTGTARTYPTITINGPSSGTARIYSIQNFTTNRSLFLNLTLNVGETVTMTLQPDNLSFFSSFVGNVASSLLPGSNVADFFLQPGANTISMLSANTTVVATMYWRPNYARLDDLTR
jgi:hypothetical protein